MAEDLRRSSNSLHYPHSVARQDNSRSRRNGYLRTSNGDLCGLTRSKYTTRIQVTGLYRINQVTASPERVLSYSFWSFCCVGYYQSALILGVSPQVALPVVPRAKSHDFRVKSHCFIKNLCTLWSRQGKRKQVQNTRVCMTHTSTTHVPACMGYLPRHPSIPDVIGAVAVWIQNQEKGKNKQTDWQMKARSG